MRFIVCELKTGDVLQEAPFTVAGELSRVLRAYGQGEVSLPLRDRRCPANWEQLILPGRNLILAVDDNNTILWSGVPVDRVRDGSGVVGYPCVTLEEYFTRRNVPNLLYTQREQIAIAEDLARLAGDAAGIPLRYDCKPSGVLRDREYAADENASVYDRLQELAAVENGFDWTVDVAWKDDERAQVVYTFRTGYPYLGYRTATPEHVFSAPGNITSYKHSESWSRGDAATHVVAEGDGDGELTPMSAPVIDTAREAAGWPRVEVRRGFSKVSVQSTLDNHAHAMAAELFGGQQVITVATRDRDRARSADVSLGDSARVTIKDLEMDLDSVLVVVGWAITPGGNEFKPTLAEIEAS